MRNRYIGVAVAAALGAGIGGTAVAAPTPTNAMQAAHLVYMGGSSAAASGILNYLEGTICGNAYSVFTTPTSTTGLPDFRAVTCSPAANQPFSGSTLTVWYRPEGGSVVGVLPVINNTVVKQLNMTAATCTTGAVATAATAAYNCTGITGTTPTNGTDDSFGAGVLSHTLDIGVSDLEPGVFGNPSLGTVPAWAGGGAQDPFNIYTNAFTGPDRSVSDLQSMTHETIFEQVFGFMVHSGLSITDLPREQIAAIFDGSVTDWHKVSTSSNAAVTSVATEIIVCNRELGSGTRAGSDIFLNGTGCNGVGVATGPIPDVAGTTPAGFTGVEPADNFQTAAEIDCVNNNPGSIGYVSIDNFSKFGTTTAPNVKAISVSGTAATLANGGEGVYGYMYEASLNLNPSASGDGTAFYNAIQHTIQAVATTSNGSQVLAIPGQGAGNTAGVPLTTASNNGKTVSVSNFSRGGGAGNSCTPLTDAL